MNICEVFGEGSEPEPSPTGHIASNPIDLLKRRYRRGHSESVRQLSVRVRVAEEEIKRYRIQKEEWKHSIAKISKELEGKQSEMESMRKNYELQLSDLQQQLSNRDHQEKRNKFETLMSILKATTNTPTVSEPPFSFLDEPKIELANAEAQTDDWMLRPVRNIYSAKDTDEEKLKSVHGPAVSSEAAGSTPGSKFSVYEGVGVERCEKLADEIAKLENEKFFLTTQLKLTRNKLENFELQEAQKMSLENRLVILTEMNDCLVKENERLKEMLATKLAADNGTLEESRKIVDIALDYQTKFDELRAELDLKSKQLEEQLRLNRILSMNVDSIKELPEAQECSETSAIKNNETKWKQYEDEISELKRKLAEYEGFAEPSGKILHIRMNPLEMAHREYKEFEINKKRKLSDSSSFLIGDNEDFDVTLRKKQRSDMMKQITDLQFQLHKVQKEKERALKIQSDLVKKYRAFVTALSGLQIKMKEDDMVQVESIFDPGNYFIFKVHDYGKTISLLETDYASQWTEQICEYLEGRNSTPAFLAAITLILDERAQSTTTVSFYNSD